MRGGGRGRGYGRAAQGHVDPAPAWVVGLTEALNQAQNGFTPENARAVVAVMDHLPTVLEEVAKFCTALGNKSVEAVELPQSAASLMAELGAMQMAAVRPVGEGLAAAKAQVADRIQRYLDARPQDAAWDVTKNQDTA